MARKKYYSERYIKRTITSLIKKHGKVRVLFRDANYEAPCSCMCKQCIKDFALDDAPDFRRRVLDKKGNCRVSYKSGGYKKWSGYTESCFMDEYTCDHDYENNYHVEQSYNIKFTLEFMFNHDRGEVKPIAIEYGKRFARKIKLE